MKCGIQSFCTFAKHGPFLPAAAKKDTWLEILCIKNLSDFQQTYIYYFLDVSNNRYIPIQITPVI